jgi:hypothetical protein
MAADSLTGSRADYNATFGLTQTISAFNWWPSAKETSSIQGTFNTLSSSISIPKTNVSNIYRNLTSSYNYVSSSVQLFTWNTTRTPSGSVVEKSSVNGTYNYFTSSVQLFTWNTTRTPSGSVTEPSSVQGTFNSLTSSIIPVGSKTLELNTTGGTAFATFTYIEPTFTNVYPNVGPTRGNTLVTLTGTNFVIVNTTEAGPVDITIQSITIGLAVTGWDVTNNTITFLTPPGTGTNDIVITWWDGIDDLFETTLQNSYTYSDIPVITIVVPDGGIVYGGTPIKITGTSFTNPVTVTIDGVPTLYAYADETNTIVTTISPPGEIGLKTLILTTKSLDESEEYTVEASFTYFSPFPTPPFTDKICPGPPYNATNFTPENSFEYDKLVNYAKNSPNYPWDSGSGAQQIYKSQQNISYFNTLNQKTESVKTMNTDRIAQGKLGNIPYPKFKSQAERLMYIQGLTLTASRNKITGTNPSAPMGVPCSTIYGIIYN